MPDLCPWPLALFRRLGFWCYRIEEEHARRFTTHGLTPHDVGLRATAKSGAAQNQTTSLLGVLHEIRFQQRIAILDLCDRIGGQFGNNHLSLWCAASLRG